MIYHDALQQIINKNRRTILFITCLISTLPFFTHQTATVQSRGPNHVLALFYAPFDTDPQLGSQVGPYLANLQIVAAQPDVDVVALIAYPGGTLYIDAYQGCPALTPCQIGQVDMSHSQTFIDTFSRPLQNYNYTQVALFLEGHGAGYIPKFNAQLVTPSPQNGWHYDAINNAIFDTPHMGLSALPFDATALPGTDNIMSTYDLGQSLQTSTNNGQFPIDVVVFNNCFNLSLELLATIEPWADYAVGFPSYNFFTAGATYPDLFTQTVNNGSIDPYQFAVTFSLEQKAYLNQIDTGLGYTYSVHPTLSGVVDLTQIPDLVDAIDNVARQLILNLHTAPEVYHPLIGNVLTASQHYDTTSCTNGPADYRMEGIDHLLDIGDFAWALQQALTSYDLSNDALRNELDRIINITHHVKIYGDVGIPYLNNNETWDFSNPQLSINIFFPNSELAQGHLWDWRTPYYIATQPNNAQPHIIPFLQTTHWPNFIRTYHHASTVVGLRGPCIPPTPLPLS